MKQVHPSYSFVASTKTITLTGLNIAQDQLLLIVNATRGVQYFNFADSSLRGTVTPGANSTVVLTDASTAGHADGDALVIYYDDQSSSQVVSGTVTANPGAGAFTVSGTVGLDSASLVALENITVTVGSSVSVSNFPATQTIAGTVTANIGPNTAELRNEFGYYPVEIANTSTTVPVSGTVTANVDFASTNGTTAPDKSVLMGWQDGDNIVPVNINAPLPAYLTDTNISQFPVVPADGTPNFPISGTVTANVIGLNHDDGLNPVQLPIRDDFDGTPFVVVGPSTSPEPFPVSGTVTANVALLADTTSNGSAVFGVPGADVNAIRTVLYSSAGGIFNDDDGAPVDSSNPLPITGTVTVSNVAGFSIPTHDFKSFAYTSGNLTQIAYKTGGASGTTVGILTLAYDGSGNLTSMTKS